MRILIETIPHSKQRYDTCGDWIWEGEDNLHVLVSECNSKTEFLVGIHEAIEAWLYSHRIGDQLVAQKSVDDFDMSWDNEEKYDEPGDDPEAPYNREHFLATTVERMLAAGLNYDWTEHEEVVEGLGK